MLNNTSLKISLSPRDNKILSQMLPHQLKFWHETVDEVLLVMDLHGYDTQDNQNDIKIIYDLINELEIIYFKIRLLIVDYSNEAKRQVSKKYFGGKKIPLKTHRYGPYYSYFFGIYHTKYDNVLNIDSDILFGGNNPLWIEEAIMLMKNKQIITCSPHPGPPREDGILKRQNGCIDQSVLRKISFDSMSTRIFFIKKTSFIREICPIPIKIANFSTVIRSIIRWKPIYELPEDTISRIMQRKNLKRIDFLGSNNGIWTLHPPYRNEEFYKILPNIIQNIENGEYPENQKGDYDINDSMINWSDAIMNIREGSIKKKISKFFKI